MRINTNVSSLNAWRNLSATDGAMSKNLERLSSGYRINRAADDVAGLAISENMRAQITGLNQAVKNAQDGTSLLQTAEGSLNEVHTMLQRMRELAVQSANGTLQADDRKQIQTEMDNLAKEVTRITNATQFNSKDLIDGSLTQSGVGAVNLQIGPNGGQTVNFEIGAMDAKSLGISRDVLTGLVDNGVSFTVGLGAPPNGANVASVVGAGTGIDSTALYRVSYAGGNLTLEKDPGTGTFAAVGSAVAFAGGANITLGTAANGETITIKTQLTAPAGAGTTDLTIGAAAVAPNQVASSVVEVGAGLIAGGYSLNYNSSLQEIQLKDALNNDIGSSVHVTAFTGQTITLGDRNTARTVDVKLNTLATLPTTDLKDQLKIASSCGRVVTQGTAFLNTTGAGVKSVGSLLDTGTYTVQYTGTTVQLFDSLTRPIGGTVAYVANTDIIVGDQATGRTITLHTGVGAPPAGAATIQVTNNGESAEAARFNGGTKYAASRAFAGLNVSSATGAADAIQIIDDAIAKVSYQRSQMGAIQNRLDHTVNNLQVVSENLTASESRIRDVDMALEMTQFTKHQILMQSGTAMLAQANQKNQAVLSLLR